MGDNKIWSKDAPTSEGWYWYVGDHYSSRGNKVIAEIFEEGGSLKIWVPHMDFSENINIFLEDADGKWFGPIEVPAD